MVLVVLVVLTVAGGGGGGGGGGGAVAVAVAAVAAAVAVAAAAVAVCSRIGRLHQCGCHFWHMYTHAFFPVVPVLASVQIGLVAFWRGPRGDQTKLKWSHSQGEFV